MHTNLYALIAYMFSVLCAANNVCPNNNHHHIIYTEYPFSATYPRYVSTSKVVQTSPFHSYMY